MRKEIEGNRKNNENFAVFKEENGRNGGNIRKTAQHDRLDSKYQHKAVHINVLTLDNPYQTQTSGNPI